MNFTIEQAAAGIIYFDRILQGLPPEYGARLEISHRTAENRAHT